MAQLNITLNQDEILQLLTNDKDEAFKNNEGKVFVDESGKANGRGAYIKKSIDTLEKAIKTKILEKNLETTISDEVYEEIRKIIER